MADERTQGVFDVAVTQIVVHITDCLCAVDAKTTVKNCRSAK
jgi:hypothetical protein